MNRSILLDLYNGEIYPAEKIVSTDPDFRPLERKISGERESLKTKLNGEDAARLEELGDMYRQSSSMDSYANNVYGFKLGAQLIGEVLEGESRAQV